MRIEKLEKVMACNLPRTADLMINEVQNVINVTFGASIDFEKYGSTKWHSVSESRYKESNCCLIKVTFRLNGKKGRDVVEICGYPNSEGEKRFFYLDSLPKELLAPTFNNTVQSVVAGTLKRKTPLISMGKGS